MNRRNAADKIDQIQSHVGNTADQLRTGVQDSAQQVRDEVKGTIDDTMQTMKENIDLRQQIEERPLMALGVALVGGFVLGSIMGGGSAQHHGNGGTQHAPHQSGRTSSLGGGVRSAVQTSQQSGGDFAGKNPSSAVYARLTSGVPLLRVIVSPAHVLGLLTVSTITQRAVPCQEGSRSHVVSWS